MHIIALVAGVANRVRTSAWGMFHLQPGCEQTEWDDAARDKSGVSSPVGDAGIEALPKLACKSFPNGEPVRFYPS